MPSLPRPLLPRGGTVTFYSSTDPNTSGDSAFGSAASSSGGTHYENDLDSLSNGTKVYGLTFGSIDVDISLGGTGGPYSNAVIFWGSFTAALLQDLALPLLAHLQVDLYGSILDSWHNGGADLPLAMVDAGRRRRCGVHVTAIDRDPATAAIAAREAAGCHAVQVDALCV